MNRETLGACIFECVTLDRDGFPVGLREEGGSVRIRITEYDVKGSIQFRLSTGKGHAYLEREYTLVPNGAHFNLLSKKSTPKKAIRRPRSSSRRPGRKCGRVVQHAKRGCH